MSSLQTKNLQASLKNAPNLHVLHSLYKNVGQKEFTLMPLIDRHVRSPNTSRKYRFLRRSPNVSMKSPLCWLLLLAVILDIQLSQCGVINPHQRDLIWAEDKSVEISNIKKRDDRHSQSNSTDEAAETISQNETLSSNETNSSEETIKVLTVNKTDGLSVNTSNIDAKVTEISQEETERQIRSNDRNKPCRSQLLSYNPLTFTSHEVGKEYNPPPVIQQPPAYAKPKPNPSYNNPVQLQPRKQHENVGNQNKYPLVPKVQQHPIKSRDNSYNPSPVQYGRPSHLLCKGGYTYSDTEGVCVPGKRQQAPVEANSNPVAGQYPVAGRNQAQPQVYASSNTKEFVRPQLKQYGIQHESNPGHNDATKVKYRAQTAGVSGAEEYKGSVIRPYGDSSISGPIKNYAPKPKYPPIASNKPNNRSPPHYHPPNTGGQSQDNQGYNPILVNPKPYQNKPQNAYGYAPTGQAPQYANEYEQPPAERYAPVTKYEPPKETYKQPRYEQPSYNQQNRNYQRPRQENQYAEEKISRPKVSYAAEENYQTKVESNPSSYSTNDDEDVESSEESYESEGGKSSSDKKCVPIRQYLAERESSDKNEDDRNDSSDRSAYSSNSSTKDGRYSSKSSSKSSGKRRKSSKNEHYNQGKSFYVNPYTDLYKIKDTHESKSRRHKKTKYLSGESKYPSNYEMTYDDEEIYVRCKKPKALNEIILPNGGIILEGEYVLQRKSGSQYDDDYEKHKHCPNYPRIIDRITIGKGGYIHKGKYTLDKDDLKYDTDKSESDGYNTGREKKEIDNETNDEDEELEIIVPFEIKADDDDDDGVHISTRREIDDEMFDSEELEEKILEKRQLPPPPRLPTIILPVDLNLVDPLVRGAAKIKHDINTIKLKIKKKELEHQVNRAVKNLKHLNKDHKEKMERLKSDLKKKLEGNPVQKTPLINRDTGNNVRTLTTTFNFNPPGLKGPLGNPLFRNLRDLNPKLPENPLARSILPERFSESDNDEDEDTVFVRRQLLRPRKYADEDEEDEEPTYIRKKPKSLKRSRHQYEDDDDDEKPSRLSLFEPAPVPVRVNKYHSQPPQPPQTCPVASHQEARSHPQRYDDGRVESTEYEMSLMPLVRKGIHTVKSLIYDVPDNYPPTRRLRSPKGYKEARPKVSRSVFNEDGYWYEKDFTDIPKVQRPREIIYSDVIYAEEPDDDYFTDYKRK